MAYYCKKGEVARRNVILRLGYRWRKLFRKFIQRSIMAKRKHSFFIDKNSFSGQVIKDKQTKKKNYDKQSTSNLTSLFFVLICSLIKCKLTHQNRAAIEKNSTGIILIIFISNASANEEI